MNFKNGILLLGLLFCLGTQGIYAQQKKEKGFLTLFDGSNMDAWQGNTQEYVLEDGCIVMKPTQEMGGNLYTKQSFGDFVLRFDFLLTPGANNGLGIRHDIVPNDKGYSGMELQILDNEDPQYKDLKAYQYHGSVYGIAAAKRGYLNKPGEWNVQEVIAKGDDITVKVNGTVILQANLKTALKDKPESSYMKAVLNKTGHIAFLGHGSEVKFRNIRIKPLK